MSSKYYAPRACSEIVKDNQRREQKTITHSLETLRDCQAFVLLGKPGMGKTTAFEQEATEPNCRYVTARDFITFDIQQDWQCQTLFIDGLDEIRAGKGDVFSPFDGIRKKLEQLGKPKFRLSCREADWYGASDREELKKVSPDGEILELFLIELKEEDLQQILIRNYNNTEAEASEFLEAAGRRELMDLIKNPQILEMLVTVVSEGNEWPERKSDIFKLACEKLLLKEWNDVHNIAYRNQSPPTKELMMASGMICAVMLLARKHGFALLRSDAGDDYPYFDDMANEHMEHLHFVTRTQLFATHEQHAEYSHRIFAEYLSAYYLSNKIITGKLPIGRVLALMTGTDGGVVTGLRGIYAWLATLCYTERTMLIQIDPLGSVLYGDVSLLSREERLELLRDLSNYAETTGDTGIDYRNTQSFGAFCQNDMEQDYRGILEAQDPSSAHQHLLEYVLASMTHGKALPGLSSALLILLKVPNCRSRNRKQALEVLIRFGDHQVLQNILNEVHQNIIPDPDDDLLGQLLLSQYPDRITPGEILNYYRTPKKPDYIGTYGYFWSDKLTRLSTNSQVLELLDVLVTKRARWRRVPDEDTYQTMAGNLLVRGVEVSGATVETKKLVDWLGLGLDEYDSILLLHQDATYLRKWLEHHPQIQKNLIDSLLDKCSKSENFDWCIYRISERLFNSDLPGDYGRWCLDKVRTAKNEQVAKYLFWQSVLSLETGKGNAGLCRELVENAAVKDARFKSDWDEYSVREINPEYGRSNRERVQQRNEQDRNKEEFVQFVRNNLANIEAGTADRGIFKNIGSVYFGYFIDAIGDAPKERLNHFFLGDPELVQSVLVGLRRFIHREDIPDVTEILQAHMENKHFVYSHPYRAGMDELARSGIQTLLELSEVKIVIALAFYFADGTEETEWYKTILQERPELVARVYSLYGTMMLRAGRTHITGSYSLAFDENHRQLTSIVVLPLLESFRIRSTSEQLAPLYDLLAAALQHADCRRFKKLIENKLSAKSMDTAQRVLWLAAGVILNSNEFEQRLTEFVSGNESRIDYLSGFLSHRWRQWSPLDNLPLQALISLIRLLGTYYAPYRYTQNNDIADLSFGAPQLISRMISQLAIVTTDLATVEIERLLDIEQLESWRPLLRAKVHEQRLKNREASFQYANLEQVRDTLNNGPPANVADLACVTNECIRELAKRIKYGNTNDYLQYWEEYPEKRQHEEICRDRFLSDLQPLLANIHVDAQREGNYVSDGRADIRVSFGGSGGYNVPIEIKCNDSRDLWHGIRDQLIERYTIDPGAYGYGIYLVFWFGYKITTAHPEGGLKPRTPGELKERLGRLLKNDEERKKISVCVVDCTA